MRIFSRIFSSCGTRKVGLVCSARCRRRCRGRQPVHELGVELRCETRQTRCRVRVFTLQKRFKIVDLEVESFSHRKRTLAGHAKSDESRGLLSLSSRIWNSQDCAPRRGRLALSRTLGTRIRWPSAQLSVFKRAPNRSTQWARLCPCRRLDRHGPSRNLNRGICLA